MRRFLQIVTSLCLAALAAACSALDVAQTPTAELINREQFAREATAIAQAGQIQATAVSGTMAAAETYVIQRESVNEQLVTTLRAAVPPTQQLVDQSGPVTPGLNATAAPMDAMTTPDPNLPAATAEMGAGAQFVDIAAASAVRDSDGCAQTPQTSFSASAARIYATARALDIRAGTLMGADWLYEGQVVFQSSSWTVNEDATDFCFWFYVEPSDVAFNAGSWSVRLYADGVAIEPAASFTIG
jgi:hypothetical protein